MTSWKPGPAQRPARHPQLQNLQPGDIVPMSPDGKQGMKLHSVNAPHSMVWGEPGGTTWAWQLDETSVGDEPHHARALALQVVSPSITFSMLLEFGDIWMTRKMLLNLKERASSSPDVPARSESDDG